MGVKPETDVETVERAMVAIRRSQRRRTLGQVAAAGHARPALPPAATGAGFEVLDAIDAAEHGARLATVTDVAHALYLDQPRASRLVAAAVAAGLVRRQADQSDGRRAPLALTAAGRRICDLVHESRRAVFASAMAGWSSADRAGFARLLSRFVEDLAAMTGGRQAGAAAGVGRKASSWDEP